MSEKKVEYFVRMPTSYFAVIDFRRLFRIDPSGSTTTSNIQNFSQTMPDQQTVADGLDDATLSVRDGRFDKFIEMGVDPGQLPGDHDMAARDLISKRIRNKFRELLVGRFGGLYGCWFYARRVETEDWPNKGIRIILAKNRIVHWGRKRRELE